ncbi:hypothetical protein [Paludisphaera soli]|uniref:hypothetical protein n=1 Tax=Paludisphaera soli TaxID=2712865 RepID=UPI0013EAC964|nr:hypothetical protein [Paludisphaera soli]
MFIKYMYVEDRRRGSNVYDGEEIGSFSTVLEALDSLDRGRRPLLLVSEAAPEPGSGYPYSGKAMEVASGPDGYTCTVYAHEGGETFVMSSGGEGAGGFRMINRPYPDEVPADQVVSKSQAIESLERFAKDGGMAGGFRWIKYP